MASADAQFSVASNAQTAVMRRAGLGKASKARRAKDPMPVMANRA